MFATVAAKARLFSPRREPKGNCAINLPDLSKPLILYCALGSVKKCFVQSLAIKERGLPVTPKCIVAENLSVNQNIVYKAQ